MQPRSANRLSRHRGTEKALDRDITGSWVMLTSPARLCRPYRLAGPAHTAANAGFSIQEGEIPRETDCLLERNGFERSVPRYQQFVASSELGPIHRRMVIRTVWRPRRRSSCRAGSGAPLTARIRRRHTKVALAAVRAHRGSKGSNPFPSSSESALWLRVRRNLTHLLWIDH